MARPKKNTIDYFPHDCDASQRGTIFIFNERYGNDGYAFWFKLLESLGSSHNHFIDLNEQHRCEFLRSVCGVGNRLEEMIDLLAEIKAIDADLWKNKIIWCQNFVDRIADGYKRRNNAAPPEKPSYRQQKPPPAELMTAETPASRVNADINGEREREREREREKDQKHTVVSKEKAAHDHVFKTWNDEKIICHKSMGAIKGLDGAIKGALKRREIVEVVAAIRNYSVVLKSPDYFFKYKWSLRDFLNRGLDKFVTEADPLQNFKRRKSIETEPQAASVDTRGFRRPE